MLIKHPADSQWLQQWTQEEGLSCRPAPKPALNLATLTFPPPRLCPASRHLPL
jgi:hypothetical protein